MENEEKNPYLFYFIIALIVLGFIASLAFPLNAQEHKLRDASDAGDFPAPNLRHQYRRANPNSAPRGRGWNCLLSKTVSCRCGPAI
jgi:hypothetical protein